MIVLTNRSIRQYIVIILAILLPLLVFFPIVFEYAERLIGHVTDPALNPFVDTLILTFIVIFTILNIRGLIKLYQRQLVSNVIPWIAIILSGLSVVLMVSTGR